MRREKQKEDLLVFNASWEDIAFRQYYKGNFAKGGLPKKPADPAEQIERDAPRVVDGRGRIWLILCYDYISDPKHRVQAWFDKNRRRVGEWRFSQITVLLYQNARARGE